jgi:catechol 2,3-dioxygenase-like lactoylglutathione lyase family enzyme
MKPRISMITLGVGNLERSVQFYEQGLKLPKMASEPSIAFFTLRGTWLGLYPRHKLAEDATLKDQPTTNAFPGFTLAHVMPSETAVDQLMDQVLSAGAKLIKKPQPVFWGGYSGYFADPDGYLWEIAYNPYFWPGPKDAKVQYE